jgi:hypothetical protein
LAAAEFNEVISARDPRNRALSSMEVEKWLRPEVQALQHFVFLLLSGSFTPTASKFPLPAATYFHKKSGDNG